MTESKRPGFKLEKVGQVRKGGSTFWKPIKINTKWISFKKKMKKDLFLGFIGLIYRFTYYTYCKKDN